MCVTITQLDALQELVNIGVGHAASILNEILSAHIRLQVPSIKIVSPHELSQALTHHIGDTCVSAMRLPFTGSLNGTALLIFPLESAAQLVTVLICEETDLPDLDAVKRGILCEVGNILLNSVMGEISNALQQALRYTIPFYCEENAHNLLPTSEWIEDTKILLAQTHLACDLLHITGEIILVFTVHSFDILLSSLDMA